MAHYPIMGSIHFKKGNMDSARYYIIRHRQYNQDNNTHNVGALALLSSIEYLSGNYYKAYKYEKLYSHLNDSINDSLRKYEVRALNQTYKNKELKESYKRLAARHKNERRAVFVSALALLAAIGIVYCRISRRREQERIEYENYAYETQKHHAELEAKYKQILSRGEYTPASLRLLKNRMDDMKFIMELMARYENDPDTFYRKFKEHTKVSAKKNQDLLEVFIATANLAHDGIIDYIQNACPDLTRYELCYCALIYMDFSPQSIRVLFNHTNIYSLYTLRNKIRKKLGIAKSTNNLEKYILDLKESMKGKGK